MKTSAVIGTLAACGLATAVGSASAQSIAVGGSRPSKVDESGMVYGQWTNRGLPPMPPRARFEMPDDESLKFIIRDGSGGWAFFDCVSEGRGQGTIRDQNELPVGGGRTLACKTSESPALSEQMLQGEDGEMYCWKGAAARYRTVSDPHLKVTATPARGSAPWTMRATSDQPWVMHRSSFSLGVVWPLWLEIEYETVDFAPAIDFSCDGVF